MRESTSRLTVSEVASQYGVTEITVLGWINSGELKAINVGRTPGKKKPRWRISAAAVAEFEDRRSSESRPAERASDRRRNKRPSQIVDLYP
jgi:excisionase family DNA binding protein